jgi:SAM-dependent methyltransferase
MEFKGNTYPSKKEAFSDLSKNLFYNESKKHSDLFILSRWGYFKKCKRILDAGCGRGEFLKLNPYNKEVFGIDQDKKLIKDLKKQGFDVKISDLNKKLPFKNDFFDGISCFHVLEHFHNPSNLLTEFKRILKDKGILVIVVPNYSFKHFYDGYDHKRPYTKISLFNVLKDNGFTNIKIEKGVCSGRLISICFFLFPKIRFNLKKFFGKLFPSEIIAIAQNSK